MTDETPSGPQSDPSVERLLTDALETRPLGHDRVERLRAAVRREWLAAMAGEQRPARSGRLRLAACAAAASLAAVMVGLWAAGPPAAAISIGTISRLDGRVVQVRYGLFRQRTPQSGGPLRLGDRLTTQGPLLVTLSRGGTLRIAAGSTVAVTGPAQVSLDRGLIYLDFPPNASAANPLRIVTAAGALEHVGTEFEVRSDAREVRVRVREGRVRLLRTGDTVIADAGTELLASPGRAVERRAIDTYGGEWLWAAALAPSYDIEGRPLIGFLQWVSRELGRPLGFADSSTRQIADRTILHGSIQDQAPIDAMAHVLATTSLTYEFRGDTIWVRPGRPNL